MEEEIFGPILPIIPFVDFQHDVIENNILSRGKPLAIYYFGSTGSKNFQDLVDKTSSGNVTANDILLQTLAIDLGFGGVGASGSGRYGGYEGFKMWSNQKSVVVKQQLNFWPITGTAPPFTENKKKLINTLFAFMWIPQNATLYTVGFVFLCWIAKMFLINQ